MHGQAMQHSEKQAHCADAQGSKREEWEGLPRRGQEIISTPTQGFWGIPAEQDTQAQPDCYHPPGAWRLRLQPPDVQAYEAGESQRFEQTRNSSQTGHRVQFSGSVPSDSWRNFIKRSTLMNKCSISCSEAAALPKNSASSKSGKPRLVMRPGRASRSLAAGTGPAARISSKATRCRVSWNREESRRLQSSTRVRGRTKLEHSSRNAWRSWSISCCSLFSAITLHSYGSNEWLRKLYAAEHRETEGVMSNAHRVLILGGGFAGLVAAQTLKRADVEITLLDRRNFHLLQPLLYQVATGSLSPAEIAAPLRAVLSRQKNVEVLLGEAVDIDPAAKTVHLADGDALSYDTLIIATGSQTSYYGQDRWRENAPSLKSIEEATAMRHKLLYAFERAERAESEEEMRAWLNFVIVGAGATGMELAGALAEIAHQTLKHDFRRIRPQDARIILI